MSILHHRRARSVLACLVLATVTTGSGALASRITDRAAAENVGEDVEPLEKVEGSLNALVQQGSVDPGVLGLDNAPVPSNSPLFFLNYPIPESIPSAHDSAEPSIGVNWKTDNAMFMMNLGVARARFDDTMKPPGVTWKDVTHPITALLTIDPMLATDPITGRTWAVQLSGEHSNTVFSDNDGETWTPTQPPTAAPSFDHETIGVGPFAPPLGPNPVYPHAVYYCAQQGIEFGDDNPESLAGGGLAQCARSDDGGLNWGPPLYAELFQCGALHSTVHVGVDGTVYLPFKDCLDQSGVTNIHRQGWVESKDNGVTWSRVLIEGSHAADSDPNLWTDDANNLYVAWSQGDGTEAVPGGPALAKVLRKDGTWGPTVDLGESFGIVNSAFPEVVAGDEGRAAVAFLGTSTAGNLEAATFQGEWHLYVSFTYDAGETWVTVDATPVDPVQRGCIWLHGGSNPCRNLLDFNGIAIDSTGRVLVAFADGCTNLILCVNRGGTPSFSRDALGTIARQSGGPRLRVASDPAPAEPVYAFARGNRVVVGEGGPVDAAALGGKPPYTFAWDFDLDGQFDDATGASPHYPAPTTGIHTIRVQATDSQGASALAEAKVLVKLPELGTLLKSWNFDSGSSCDDEGWISRAGFLVSPLELTVSADGSQWHLTDEKPASPPCAWYVGEDNTREYRDASVAQLDSPAGDGCFFLPPGATGATLSFKLAGSSEVDFDFLIAMVKPGPCIPDTPENKVSSAAAFTELARWHGKVGDLSATPPQYAEQVVSLDHLAGTGGGFFQIRFRFVVDDLVNDEGFQIDDIKLYLHDLPPEIAPIEDRTIFTTDDLAFTVAATDPDNDPVTLGASNLPQGASFDSTTGAFAWSPGDEQEGVYEVTFTATDGAFTDSETVIIEVLNVPPIAAGTADRLKTDRSTPVQFTDKSTDPDGTVVAWLWEFGDGTTSTEQNPSHTYSKVGKFKVSLTVTDDDGASTTVEVATIRVSGRFRA